MIIFKTFQGLENFYIKFQNFPYWMNHLLIKSSWASPAKFLAVTVEVLCFGKVWEFECDREKIGETMFLPVVCCRVYCDGLNVSERKMICWGIQPSYSQCVCYIWV